MEDRVVLQSLLRQLWFSRYVQLIVSGRTELTRSKSDMQMTRHLRSIKAAFNLASGSSASVRVAPGIPGTLRRAGVVL